MTFRVAVPYTPEQEATVRSMLAKGFSTGAIANRLKRSDSSIVSCLERLEKRDAKTQKVTRPCLCCRTEFKSDGPHNRLCGKCRTKETTPFDS